MGQRLDTLVDTIVHVGLFPAMAVGLLRISVTGVTVLCVAVMIHTACGGRII